MGCARCCGRCIQVITCVIAIIAVVGYILTIVRCFMNDEKRLVWVPITRMIIMLFVIVAIYIRSRCFYILALIGMALEMTVIGLGLSLVIIYYNKEGESFKEIVKHEFVYTTMTSIVVSLIIFVMVIVSCKTDEKDDEDGQVPQTTN